jgi:ubiquinone/menaquinone biosynthesis C-methylase UbiE
VKNQELERTKERLKEEFNRWAAAGRGEEMREEHLAITRQMLAQIRFAPDEKILDVGCGAGWLAELVLDKIPQGQLVGMDVADEMVRRARQAHADRVNAMFLTAAVDDIPWDDNFFTKALSVESAYYWPDPARGLGEIFRVLRPGGSLWILINLYQDNPHAHQWVEKLAVPVQVLSAAEWCRLLEQAGFVAVRSSRVPDPRPVPEGYQSRWFRDADELRQFRQEGALLVAGEKPAPERRTTVVISA